MDAIHTPKRVSVFTGHYGSGKTNLAVNYALWLRRTHARVMIADLDIVNPYFRTKDSRAALEAGDVRLISSPYAGSNVDVPALPAEMYALTDDTASMAVIDVGGDDRGALALGRCVPAIRREANYEMFFVINRYRPLTQTAGDTVAVLREIEEACQLRCTAIISNSNLGSLTTADTILSSSDYAAEVSAASGLPVAMTAVRRDLCAAVASKLHTPVFPVDILVCQQL